MEHKLPEAAEFIIEEASERGFMAKQSKTLKNSLMNRTMGFKASVDIEHKHDPSADSYFRLKSKQPTLAGLELQKHETSERPLMIEGHSAT